MTAQNWGLVVRSPSGTALSNPQPVSLFNARNRRNQTSTPGIILMDEHKTGMPTNNTQEV